MDDLITRLRDWGHHPVIDYSGSGEIEKSLVEEAIAEIERLRAAVKRLNTECDDLTEIAYPTTE